jgi:formyltetrahydrofolate deformylase
VAPPDAAPDAPVETREYAIRRFGGGMRAEPRVLSHDADPAGGRTGADIGRLLITCPDRPGIVAAVSRLLFDDGTTICESQQYSTDPFGGTFFLRVQFHRPHLAAHLDRIQGDLARLADRFSMRWHLNPASRRKRVAIMVSKADHVLREILWRSRGGELDADVRLVISNHPDVAGLAAESGVPFHHVPVSKENQAAAEDTQLALLPDVDLVVLARYMRILSPRFLAEFARPVINIHHSFLPAFAGADPYAAAARRGVKLVGATAHYATAELDAGPIIEQDIVRVDHRCSVDDLKRLGRDVERAVLTRALGWHLDDRVIVHDNKTIVFA